MGVPKAIGSDVPNFVKNVPNFVKDVQIVPKCVPGWRSAPNHFIMGSKMKIMDHPCSDKRLKSNKIGCTKFNQGCTKFCEWCTKGSKLHFEVGISPQSLPYGLLKEIMDHPCSDGGPESNRIGCTKFNERCIKFYERCTKFCEGCTKRSKVSFKVGINPQSLPYEF